MKLSAALSVALSTPSWWPSTKPMRLSRESVPTRPYRLNTSVIWRRPGVEGSDNPDGGDGHGEGNDWSSCLLMRALPVPVR